MRLHRLGRTLRTGVCVLVVVASTAGNSPSAEGQPRSFVIGVTREDASIVPLFLAKEISERSRSLRIELVSLDPESALLALRAGKIDLLYTDGLSALVGASRGTDLVFVAGALEYVTGSVFASPVPNPRVKDRALGAALKYPATPGFVILSFEAVALSAVLRSQYGVKRVDLFSNISGKEVTPEQVVADLRAGRIDFAYFPAELVRFAVSAKLKELRSGSVELQGMVLAVLRPQADSAGDRLLSFLKSFVEGVRAFNDPERGLNAMQTYVRLDSKSAGYVYETYRSRKAFSFQPVPNPRSVDTLGRELIEIDPTAKLLGAEKLIHLGPLRKLGIVRQ